VINWIYAIQGCALPKTKYLVTIPGDGASKGIDQREEQGIAPEEIANLNRS
jgi:hypothetical protein